MLKKLATSALVAITAASVAPAFAAGETGLAALTAGVSFTEVVTAIMAVGVLLAGLYVSIRGAKIVLAFLRR